MTLVTPKTPTARKRRRKSRTKTTSQLPVIVAEPCRTQLSIGDVAPTEARSVPLASVDEKAFDRRQGGLVGGAGVGRCGKQRRYGRQQYRGGAGETEVRHAGFILPGRAPRPPRPGHTWGLLEGVGVATERAPFRAVESVRTRERGGGGP
ncbi:hypothetical protein [Streptomyces sp. NPDC006879]|uniref:hypothetical protein n=1 Tax=Streptomyces sp. NPDC006879 TaxID=3364767 RepID=UPI0036A67847